MNGEVLKSFLVSLGFGVDEKSLKSFVKAVDNSLTKVKLMSAAITGLAGGAFFGIAKISEGFEEMGYSTRMIAPAINKAILLRKAMVSAYQEAGINVVDAVQKSVKFNMALAKTKFQLEAIAKSTAVKFIPLLTKQMDAFRAKVSSNMPKILKTLESFTKFVFNAFDALTTLAGRVWSMLSRVWDLFERLDTISSGWSTTILGVVAAWKLLNLSFLATPLGMLLTGLLSILALYDDFMTFKEGGESLFDWGSDAVKTIAGVTAAVVAMIATFTSIIGVIKVWKLMQLALNGVMVAFNIVMSLNPLGLIVIAVTSLIGLIGLLIYKWETVKKSFTEFFSGIGGKALSFFGGINDVGTKSINGATPPGVNNTNSSNQTISQKTEIIVQGSSNPEQTAQAIGSAQSRVNADLTRNLKGAIQ